jgi:hypothetical protein
LRTCRAAPRTRSLVLSATLSSAGLLHAFHALKTAHRLSQAATFGWFGVWRTLGEPERRRSRGDGDGERRRSRRSREPERRRSRGDGERRRRSREPERRRSRGEPERLRARRLAPPPLSSSASPSVLTNDGRVPRAQHTVDAQKEARRSFVVVDWGVSCSVEHAGAGRGGRDCDLSLAFMSSGRLRFSWAKTTCQGFM